MNCVWRHTWGKWEVQQRRMTLTGLNIAPEDKEKVWKVEYQERVCMLCGWTQRHDLP